MPSTIAHSHSHPDSPPAYLGGQHNLFKILWEEVEIPLLVFLGLLSILLGTIGFQLYFSQTGEAHNFGRSLYASLELLEFLGGNLASPIPWELEVARWLSPAVTMYAILLGLATVFRNQLQTLRLRFVSNHVVICGLGGKGFLLAKNFHASGRMVAVIENEGNNSYIPACRDLGITVVLGDARDEYTLREAGVESAQSLIAVCGDDGANAEIAVKARHIVSKRSGQKLSCAIHIRDPRLWVFLRHQEFNADKDNAFRLDFFNIYDHGARQLLREYQLFPQTKNTPQKAPHLLIVGLGNLGEQIVIYAARQWSPLFEMNAGKLQISVVDPDAQRKIDVLSQEYSLVKKTCEWRVYPLDINHPEFHQAKFVVDKDHQPSIAFIYVCLDDETVGLSSALSLLEQTRTSDVQILVRMTEDVGLASLLHGNQEGRGSFARLHVFGLMERTCKPSLLNDGSHEALARAIHEEYIRNETRMGNTPETNPSMLDWDQLSEERKEWNRSQADDIGIKLNAVDCDIVPWSDYGSDRFTFKPAEIELLAQIEHERWCKQRIEEGWQYAPLRDDQKKLHPSMLGWDDPRFSEVEKEKDRNTVTQIPKYLALAGFQIFRVSSLDSE